MFARRFSRRLVSFSVALAIVANWPSYAQPPDGVTARARLIDVFVPSSEDEIGNPKSLIARIGPAIDAGADVDASDEYGNTPLFTAVYWASIFGGDFRGPNETVSYLLSRGANPNMPIYINANGAEQTFTVLHIAVTMNQFNTALIEILCAAGANPRAVGSVKVANQPVKLISILDVGKSALNPQIRQAIERCDAKR